MPRARASRDRNGDQLNRRRRVLTLRSRALTLARERLDHDRALSSNPRANAAREQTIRGRRRRSATLKNMRAQARAIVSNRASRIFAREPTF